MLELICCILHAQVVRRTFNNREHTQAHRGMGGEHLMARWCCHLIFHILNTLPGVRNVLRMKNAHIACVCCVLKYPIEIHRAVRLVCHGGGVRCATTAFEANNVCHNFGASIGHLCSLFFPFPIYVLHGLRWLFSAVMCLTCVCNAIRLVSWRLPPSPIPIHIDHLEQSSKSLAALLYYSQVHSGIDVWNKIKLSVFFFVIKFLGRQNRNRVIFLFFAEPKDNSLSP